MEDRPAEIISNPAFCRRPLETRILEPSEVAEKGNAAYDAIAKFLDGLPLGVEVSTEELSFREGFHQWLKQLDRDEEVEEDNALRPKSHHHKERILKEPLPPLETTKAVHETASKHSYGVDDIVEKAGNVFRTRHPQSNKRSRHVEDDGTSEPDEDTVEVVRTSIEKLSKELDAAHAMIAQKNANLRGAPYRQNLFRMYRRIARHLEECEGRVFDEKQKSKRTPNPLTPQDIESIEQKIVQIEERMEGTQHSGSLQCMTLPKTSASASNVLMQETPQSSEAVTDTFQAMDSVVIEIDIVHPSFLKSRSTSILALGEHSIADVIELSTCTCDDAMKALNKDINPRYVFIEGVFYVDPDDAIVLQDIEHIREFCATNRCRWALDVAKSYIGQFLVAPWTTPLQEVPMRASNKPLYLYVHRGGCEHLVHIRNIRLPHVTDPNALTLGPILRRIPHVTFRKCSICEKQPAALVVYGSMMNVTDPCFYCEVCYELGHFGPEGEEKSQLGNVYTACNNEVRI